MKKSVSHTSRKTRGFKPALIVSDLDGTLLQSDSTLSAKTVRVIKKINAAGHLFCIATGRTPQGSLHYYKELGLDTILVNLNGSFIWHPNNPEFMPINIVFSRNLVWKLIESQAIKKYVDNLIVETRRSTHLWKVPRTEHEVKEFKQWFNIDFKSEKNYHIGTNALYNMEEEPNTVLLQIRDRANIDKMMYLLKQTFDTFMVRSWSLPNSGNIIEINTKYANKGNAVDFLMSYYGVARDNTYSFGDSDNDVELVLRARSGFAMRNGKNSVKLVARYITAHDNNDAGVAIELERFLLKSSSNKKRA